MTKRILVAGAAMASIGVVLLLITKSGTPAPLNEEDILYADNFGPGVGSGRVRRTRPHHQRRALVGGEIEYYHTIGGADDNESSNVDPTTTATTTTQSTRSGGLSVFSIHQAMGGEVEVNPYHPITGGGADNNGGTMQVFSSTPFHPRQFKVAAGTGTEYIHYKNSKEKDGYGDSTFPPTSTDFEGYPTYSPMSDTFAPIEAMYGWFQPTVTPTTAKGVDATVDELFPEEEEEEEETKRPTKTPTKRPDKDPTPEPTKLPTKDPTPEPTKEPTEEPTKRPTKNRTPEPTKMKSFGVEDTPEPTKMKTPEPTKMKTPEPTKKKLDDDDDDEEDDDKVPNLELDEDKRKPEGGFYCGTSVKDAGTCDTPCPNGITDCVDDTAFCYAVAQCPEGGPGPVDDVVTSERPTVTLAESDSPTLVPTSDVSPSDKPSKSPLRKPDRKPGGYYCGSTIMEAGSCNTPCESIADCDTGSFCYNIEVCPKLGPGPVGNVDTSSPTSSSTGVFYCGDSPMEASRCRIPCPNGIEDCVDGGFCYAVTECTTSDGPGPVGNAVMPKTDTPTSQPTDDNDVDGRDDGPGPVPDVTTSRPDPDSFYCGATYQEASATCDLPCPSGKSGDCPPGMACYANTPCDADDKFFYCGSSMVNASASCEYSCPTGLDEECPTGLTCYGTETCKDRKEPIGPPKVADGTKYCGYTYEHASTICGTACPNGRSEECPTGMDCYSSTPCEDTSSFYCGLSWNNAASSCKLACPSGEDDDCPTGTHCYKYTPCNKNDTFMCGIDFEDASSSCDRPCPTGSSEDCPLGLSCFTHTTCTSGPDGNDGNSTIDDPSDPQGNSTNPEVTSLAPTLSPPYIPGDSYFCGTSFLEASSQCTHPCPSRMDSECPTGEQCYGNTPCPTRETYYCGANLHEASAMCEYPCPSGSSSECPTGTSCFGFTTCKDKSSFFCGDNFMDAVGTCDLPCPSGLSSDCPPTLTCFAHTTCDKEDPEPMNNSTDPTGPDDLSAFCGVTFDDATRSCSLPCPSGMNIDCPDGMTCHPHTSCQDRDSFMCGTTWDEAAATCSDPCPSGEHSDCATGMKCFAYTPCNNAASFFCGTSFDEAGNCELPCPSGSAGECPGELNCFSYTSCGVGDFNPTMAPVPTPAPSLTHNHTIGDSFYCGTSFKDASGLCEHPCATGNSTECPTGLACFQFTTCVGRDEIPTPAMSPVGEGIPTPAEEGSSSSPTTEFESFYCGFNYVDANAKCATPCPGGTSLECPFEESCMPFTTCNKVGSKAPSSNTTTMNGPDKPSTISNTFFCGTSKEEAEATCEYPCPLGPSECPDDMDCFSFTTCTPPSPPEVSPKVPSPSSTSSGPTLLSSGSSNPEPTSFYCGTSFENATSTCSTPCSGGSSLECPNGQSCYGYTSCADKDSFFCGKTWEDASSDCTKSCHSNDDCDNDEACFGYTTCNIQEKDIPVESFYCGNTFEEASMMCSDACPSGKHYDCPDGQLCHPYTPCGERDSFYCGSSWVDAATSCLKPCPSGSSSDCPEDQLCFPSTPCDEVQSFFCGSTFDDANDKCGIPCASGRSSDCYDGQGCFAYTLCSETGTNAVPTPPLPPIPSAPPESFFCGASFDDASMVCDVPCPNGKSEDCPNGQLCFASTPCSDRGSFFCGTTWERAAATCSIPCTSGLNSDCPDGEICHAYTPCSKTETFYCGTSFLDASSTCTDPCPTGNDDECSGSATCHKYTPCNDINPSDNGKDPLVLPYPVDSYFCGTNFVDASTKCYLPCPTGGAAECPIGEACYGNTACSSGDSSFCGKTWYDAASQCKDPCPTGLDEECPDDTKCFGYTPCSENNSFFCGVDFLDASNSCTNPCPSGSSAECPNGLACFPNTPCDMEPSDNATNVPAPTTFSLVTTAVPTKFPSVFMSTSSAPTLALIELKATFSPTLPDPIINVGTSYCGKNYTDAATSCSLACPSGSSAECAELGPEYSCFGNTPCDDRDSYFCGTSWSHASSNCLFPCRSGEDDECPDDTFCFPYTTCDKTNSFMCGTSFDHASSCERPCPSGSSSECSIGESCFTHTSCGVNDTEVPPASLVLESSVAPTTTPYVPEDSFFCGTSFTDASTQCTSPCPTRLDSECPNGQKCYANTPCPNRETYFCGASLEDASGLCEHPCPTGSSDECPESLSCYAFTTCADKSSYFCGANYIDASTTCTTPCESGQSSDCPDGLSCFAFTTCNEDDGIVEAFCGKTFDSQDCSVPCGSSDECPVGEACFPFTSCEATPKDYPVESFFCGTTFEEASMSCTDACPSGSHADCPAGQFCFPRTPCNERGSYYCGTSMTDASTNCQVPCPSGSDTDCPLGTSCFPATSCEKTDSFFCGLTFEDATSSCSIPCEKGQTSQCPDGLGCFAHTLCNENGTIAAPSGGLEPIPTAPPESYFCGTSYDNATSSCAFECSSGSSDECPGDLQCYGGTSCKASGSFFCGKRWEEAASSCTLPCSNGLDSTCPFGEQCFGYTPCMRSDTFFCGLTFDDASTSCDKACPSGLDTECPGSETCHKYTTCADGLPADSVPSFNLTGSFFCGTSYDDASENCAKSCESGSSVECPIGQACYPGTPCISLPEDLSEDLSDSPTSTPSMPANELEDNIPIDSFFCGLSYEKASDSCSVPCSSGEDSECPDDSKCFAFTPCSKPETFFCGTSMDDASESCAIPCPSGKSNSCPMGQSCYAYTTCEVSVPSFSVLKEPEEDNVPEEDEEDNMVPNFTDVPDIPIESFFCGLSYEKASDSCSVPCSSGEDSECPDDSKCFAFTPCSKPETFFCGTSMDDANESCAIPCPSGKSNSCPMGQSCYAYTTCEVVTSVSPTAFPTLSPTTEAPTSKPRTEEPTDEPTDEPTFEPTLSPITAKPTLEPTDEPTWRPTLEPTDEPTMKPTPLPTTKRPTLRPTKKPIIPVTFDVPEDSFFCGVTFDHASDICAVACPNGGDDCPPGLTCFGNTPCGDKNSFFCGTSFEDANGKCTTQCTTGSATDCPSGESCFAYTQCKPDTEAPTESPTDEPTPNPTKMPTPYPTKKSTRKPTKKPTNKPITPVPEEEETETATLAPTDAPAEEEEEKEEDEEKKEEEEVEDKEKEPEEEEEEEEEDEEKEPAQEEEEEEEDEKPEAMAEAVTITFNTVCEDPLAMTVNQAYWRSWSSDNPETCNRFDASDIDGTSYTHVVYSFASISADGHVEPWVGSWDEVDKYKEFNKIKERSPDVKTVIAVTEGTFYGSGMNPTTFNEVVATESSRMEFAESVVAFLELYDFDGIELDWEAPLDTDKGGSPDNYQLFVLLAEEIRLAIDKSGKEFVFTLALPPTDWEMYDFDVIGLSEHVDWFNLQSFDYHTPKNIPKTVGAHSDLKMIDSVVFELLKETASTKFVLGMAAFGRTYSLADNRCQELGCPFRSPGLGGCGNTKGFLPFSEIHDYIESNSYDQLHQDVSSSSMLMVVDGDQMISFDDESTWKIKEAYAEMMCLRGTMLWSVDMLKPKSSSVPSSNTVETVRHLSTVDSTTCDICAEAYLIHDKIVMYAGNATTCGELSALHHLTKRSSLDCSIARTLLTSSCCSSITDKEQHAQPTLTPKSCSICQKNGAHHELKSEELVEYKGTSITCLNLNSILAKNEVQDSDMCADTQYALFDDCCYEKCTLCGDKSMKNDATVKYNDQIISCNELSQIFTFGIVHKGSDQCDAMQVDYTSTCCFSSPKKSCSLCDYGSVSMDVNTHSFIKTRSSSMHCMNLANGLAQREEEGSPVCEESKLDYAPTCCIASSSPNKGADDSYYDWLADHLIQSAPNTGSVAMISLWSLFATTTLLLLAF